MRLGIDVGSVRVGVAASDASGTLATPVTALRRDSVHDRDLDEIADLAAEREVVEVVVGLPRSLSGGAGPAEAEARRYAKALAARLDPTPVRLLDERLTTVSATAGMRAAGVPGREQRGRVDAAAAAVLLQAALDQERSTGEPPGERVETD